MIAGIGLEPNHVWAPCCETWLKFEGKFAIVEKTGEGSQGFLFTGFVPTGWAPCCE
jgi:hypothetical protein